ncbi:MAG: glycosyltransferase, partial [Terriglobales bacterium]
LQCMDILVLSSDHEGLPMILLEALSLGVNVVARSVGGIPEAITDGVHGVLVDSADPAVLAEKCLQLRADPIRRKRMAQEGFRRVADHFAMEQTASKVAALYRSLVDSRLRQRSQPA